MGKKQARGVDAGLQGCVQSRGGGAGRRAAKLCLRNDAACKSFVISESGLREEGWEHLSLMVCAALCALVSENSIKCVCVCACVKH